MAQVEKRVRMGERFGLKTPVAVAVALVAFVTACCIGAVAIGLLGKGGVQIDRSQSEQNAALPEKSSGPAAEQDSQLTVVVHVDGAVRAPGVYEVVGEVVRVNDAIRAAGGLSEDADTSNLNLASQVKDGDKVHVPTADEAASQTDGAASNSSTVGTVTSVSSGSGLVNINTATSEELQTLSGVGESTAAAIISDRQEHGNFSSIEDLMRVSGIGEKKFAKVKDQICV